MKLDGRKLSGIILSNLKLKVDKLRTTDIVPTMAVILVGDDPNSLVYIKQKQKKAEAIGAKTELFRFDEGVLHEDIKRLVIKLNNDPKIHGLIIQRPTPDQINISELSGLIDPKKEIDGFGENSIYPVPVAQAVLKLIEDAFKMSGNKQEFRDWLKNQNIVIIGKGETAGMPIINILRKLGVKPLIVDSKTKSPDEITKSADILVSSVGKEGFVTPDKIKKGVMLIGVGLTSNSEGKLVGDYDEEKIKEIASFYTPTPGGVGPVNVAYLMTNLVQATEKAS